MKSFLLALVMLFGLMANAVAQTGSSQAVTDLTSANALLEEAHLAFERGDFPVATRSYLRVAQGGFGTATVWANAGTAAYREGDTGRAVLYYLRALQQDPRHQQAMTSLSVISPKTNDAGSGAAEAIRSVLGTVHPLLWVTLAQGGFLVVCFAVGRAVGSRDRDDRGHWFAVLGWSLVFTVVLGGVAYLNHDLRVADERAVVMVENAIARSGPAENATEELALPAGTIVTINEEPRRGFVRVRFADGTVAFLAIDDLERV